MPASGKLIVRPRNRNRDSPQRRQDTKRVRAQIGSFCLLFLVSWQFNIAFGADGRQPSDSRSAMSNCPLSGQSEISLIPVRSF